MPLLVPLLSNSEVNHIVPWALGGIGEPTAVSPLMQILTDKKSRYVDFGKQEKTSASEQFKMGFVPSHEERAVCSRNIGPCLLPKSGKGKRLCNQR